MNSYVLLILDSCRYDSMAAAWPTLQHIPKLGELQRAYSFASWTFASHILFTLGRLPWTETRPDTAQQKTELDDLRRWQTRLGLAEDNPFRREHDLRNGLHRLGYQLTEQSRFAGFVDDLVSVGQFQSGPERVLPKLDLSTPQYLIINVCETHYPYWDGAYDPQFSPLMLYGFAALCGRRLRIER